jgi:hypothetical protein
MSTNIQDFSGDIQIRGTTFIKANSNTNNLAIGTNAGLTVREQRRRHWGPMRVRPVRELKPSPWGSSGSDAVRETNALAVGRERVSQSGNNAVAVGIQRVEQSGNLRRRHGDQAGRTSQGVYAIAVGYQAGQTSQGANAVAVGNQAGQTSQGTTPSPWGYSGSDQSGRLRRRRGVPSG